VQTHLETIVPRPTNTKTESMCVVRFFFFWQNVLSVYENAKGQDLLTGMIQLATRTNIGMSV
jgi:hypothetical protein